MSSYSNPENYNKVTTDNDITIIELAQEVDLNTYTPACMAKTSDTTTFDGKNAWVYGEIILLHRSAVCGLVPESQSHRLGGNILWRSFLQRLAGGGGARGDQGDLHHRHG